MQGRGFSRINIFQFEGSIMHPHLGEIAERAQIAVGESNMPASVIQAWIWVLNTYAHQFISRYIIGAHTGRGGSNIYTYGI